MSAIDTLLSPVILFFVLGIFAGFARSDLAIPEAIAKGMSIYLMAAIGLKGGVEVSHSGFSTLLIVAALAGMMISFCAPFGAFALLRSFGRLDKINAGAIAAHYGSVSVVTFVTAREMLGVQNLEAAGFMVAVLALMETPAIISGLLLARSGGGDAALQQRSHGRLLHEVFLNGSVVLLVGAFLIGLIVGKDGYEPVSPLFTTGFQGVLCLFLLDMGLIAARRLRETRSITPRLAAVAIILPIINGAIGTVIGTLIGLDTGSAAILGVLAASASYIAVPAAMRLALPQADAGLSLAMSLGITFPFNVIVGISLIAAFARWIG